MRRPSLEKLLFRPAHRGWTAAALAAIVAVGVVDGLTGPEITFSPFYLVPVAAAAWLSGARMAVAASTFAAIVWLIAEIASSRLDTNPLVYTWNFFARGLFLVLVAWLLAQLRGMLNRERDLSRTDWLTALLNARAFREVAEAEIARSQRHGQPFSLAFIDIDDFKRINDRHGHADGDRLLKRVAEVLRRNLRTSDSVARYGGDEFVVLLPVTHQEAARAVVGKLRERILQALLGEGWPVTVSIGVVTVEPGASTVTVDALLENADHLMYEVKAAGKNAVRFAPGGR